MTARAAKTQRRTRIQVAKEEVILEAALDVFSANGFRGATVDQIAEAAGMSKPNVLYYFRSKEAMFSALIESVMDIWLDPLRVFDVDKDPEAELRSYIRRKLEMARDFPRESRLFANEAIQGQGHPRLAEGRQAAQGRPLPPDLLDLGNHPALCGFRRPGARRSQRGAGGRGPVRGCGALPRNAVRQRSDRAVNLVVNPLRAYRR